MPAWLCVPHRYRSEVKRGPQTPWHFKLRFSAREVSTLSPEPQLRLHCVFIFVPSWFPQVYDHLEAWKSSSFSPPASLVISVHMVGKPHLYNMESYEMWSMEACSFHNKRFYFIFLYVPTASFWMRSPTKKTKYSQIKIPNASPLCFRTISSWGIPTRSGRRLTFNCALSADVALFTITSIWPNSKIRTEILIFHVSTETRSTPQITLREGRRTF